MRLVHNTWTEQRQRWNIILQLLAMRTSLRQQGVSVDQIWWTSKMTNTGKKSWRISNLYGGHRVGMIQTSCHYRLASVSDSIISLFRLCVRLHYLSLSPLCETPSSLSLSSHDPWHSVEKRTQVNDASPSVCSRCSRFKMGIYALRKAHMRSTPSPRRFPTVAFETVAMFVVWLKRWPFFVLSRKIVRRVLFPHFYRSV